MAALEIEFIRRRRKPLLGYAFLCVVGIGCAVLYIDMSRLQNHQQAIIAKSTAVEIAFNEKKRRIAELRDKQAPQVEQNAKAFSTVVAALHYPWNRVLGSIEAAPGAGIALLAFTHDQAKGQSQLTLQSADVPVLVSYVDRLNVENEGEPWQIATYQLQPGPGPFGLKATVVKAARSPTKVTKE